MKRFLALIAILLSAVVTKPLPGQELQGIAAVVNDDVISVFDLEARINLIIKSLGLEDNSESRVEMKAQILQTLIDEKLQIQEANNKDVKISDSDIEDALHGLEEKNGVEEGKFREYLTLNGLEPSALISQLRATLTWNKLVNRRLRSQIDVGKEEVDETIARMKENKGKPEYRVAEIFLSVNSPGQDRDVRRTADQIIDHLRGGKSFSQLARQFSQSATAATSGDLGWIQHGQLDEEIDSVIKTMQVKQVVGPIRGLTGYYIIYLHGKRISGSAGQAEVSLRQIFMPLPPEPTEDETALMENRLSALMENVEGCDAMAELTDESGVSLSTDLGTLAVGDLPSGLQDVVSTVEIDTPSKPIIVSGGAMVLMVCERTEPETIEPDRQKIKDVIEFQRLDMMARRYLRDLRRAAHIDIRVDTSS